MFYGNDYMISVEIDASSSITNLRDALQQACDQGAECQFRILTTKAPSFVVLLWRDASEDAPYIAARMKADGEAELAAAAFEQLAGELSEPGIELLDQMVANLKAGKADLIHFGSLDDIEVHLKPRLEGPPKVIHPINGAGGLCMVLIRPRTIPCERYGKRLAEIAEAHGYCGGGETTVGTPCRRDLDTDTQLVWFHNKKEG